MERSAIQTNIKTGVRIVVLSVLYVALTTCSQKEQTVIRHDVSPLVYLPLVSKSPGPQSYKGIGATYSQCEYMDGIGWYYNWGTALPACERVESVSMLWDETFVGNPLYGTSRWLMGFNEPELPSQANISPRDAAVLWREIESIYPSKYLVSPSVLYLSWLDRWYSEYQNLYGRSPRVDAVGVHCYGGWNALEAITLCKAKLEATITWAEERGIRQIWVTEYAYLPCMEGVQGSIDFMEAMREYFDSKEIITRDAWFQLSYRGDEPWAFGPHCNTSLVDFYTGRKTALGDAY